MSIFEYKNLRLRRGEWLEDLLKVLADENRLRMINLMHEGELCVCELEAILETSQSNVSRHLARLRNEEIVVFERKAQWTYYQLNPSFLEKHAPLIDYLIDQMQKEEVFVKDLKQLDLYKQGKIHCGLMTG